VHLLREERLGVEFGDGSPVDNNSSLGKAKVQGSSEIVSIVIYNDKSISY
jgi:hypothetical protein